ncbi:MAG: hypothetical protein FRX49_03401 [Trebouxia sp. A1-2]|nr:MAG: hypothetical protein FRX49_03401 [Trebouxia sp. A1-2]
MFDKGYLIEQIAQFRPSDAIYSRIDEDWKTQEEETRSFFIKLCGSKADEALAEAKQSPAAKQEPATVADTAVPDQQAIASKLVSAKPLDQPQAPSTASIPEGQAVPAASADPSRDIGDRKRSTATAAPGLKKRKRAAAQVAAHATAVDTAAAAVADENSGESPVEKQKTGTANDWPSLVQVVCNGMRGMFDAAYTMVMPSTGKRCRPSVFVQSAGMGHVGKWQEIIRVDDGEGVPGIAIGHWLKEAKRNGLKRTGGRPQAAKATAASPKEADPLDVAISAYPEASPSGQQQANVKSPAGSERATDAETSPNKKAAESQAGTKNLFKHKHKPGIACLACNEAKRQKRIQRQAQLTQDGSIPQGEASPTEGVPDAKAGRANRPDGQHGGAAIAAVTENGQISSGAAEGSAWVPVELDFGEKPTSPFSKAAAQQHLKLGSGNKAPKLASTAQLHSSSKSTKSSQVSKPSVGRPPKLDSLSTTNSAGKGSAEAAGPGLEAGADVSVKAGVGTKPGVTLLIKGHKGSLPGVSHPQCSSNADSAADGGDAGTSPSNGLRSPKSPSSPTSPSRKSAVTSHKHVSSAAVLSHDLGQTPSEKVASPTNPSSQPAPALSKKVSSPPSPAPVSALTSPEKVSSPPDPAAATIAPQPSVTGDTRDKGVSPMQEVALISKMDLNTGAQPQRKLGMKRKRSTEAAACDGAAKKSSANFGGLSIVPLPKAKPSPPEGHLIEEQMDEDQPYWAGRNAPHLPSWPGPHGAAEAEPWRNRSSYMGGSAWPASGLQNQPGSSGQVISGAGGALRSPALDTTQVSETLSELHELPEPGEDSKAAGGVMSHRTHPRGQIRQQPHEFLRSLGLHEHSQGQHHRINEQPSPQAPGMLTASSYLRQSVGNSEWQPGRLSLQTLGSSASQDGSQHPQEPKQHPQGSSWQPQGTVREQFQLQSQGSFSMLQSTRQHPAGSDQAPQSSNQRPQPSQLLSRGSRMSQTPSETGSHSQDFGILRSTPISAQPQSMRVKLSYKWGTNSSVSGVLDLMAHSWSTNRVGRCWAGAGYTDTPLNSMLMRSVFMGTLKSEGSLGTSAWQSALREWWDGNLVVFTLPGEVAANCLQAATASMNLARVVKLLRNGQPLITNLSVAQAGGHSVCKQHVARLWLTRPRGVTDTLLDMLSQEAKASLEEVVPGLLQKRDDAKRSYMIGLITLTGGTA